VIGAAVAVAAADKLFVRVDGRRQQLACCAATLMLIALQRLPVLDTPTVAVWLEPPQFNS